MIRCHSSSLILVFVVVILFALVHIHASAAVSNNKSNNKQRNSTTTSDKNQQQQNQKTQVIQVTSEPDNRDTGGAEKSSFRLVLYFFLITAFVLCLIIFILVMAFLCDILKSAPCFQQDSLCLYMNGELNIDDQDNNNDDLNKRTIRNTNIVRDIEEVEKPTG